MKNYRVKVNGEEFCVEIEEANKTSVFSGTYAPASAAPAFPVVKTEEKAASAPAQPGSASVIACPMPGTILSVDVKAGSRVRKGQVLLILEAMKMENEIMAPKDGVVSKVFVTKGSTVNAGDILVAL